MVVSSKRIARAVIGTGSCHICAGAAGVLCGMGLLQLPKFEAERLSDGYFSLYL